MTAINVAVWGLGPHAIKNILPALKVCPGIHLYGVCSRNSETVSKCALEFGCLGWSDSASMLEDSHVDVIYLSTPIGVHFIQGKAVLLANKHLWCEKPLAENLEQVLMLVNLSRERGLTLAEGFMYLYHSQFRYLQEVLHSEILGHVQSITCRFGIPPLVRPGFRVDPQVGGGAFLDVGSYPISAVTSFFPKLSPEVLFSEITSASGSRVDTTGRAILRYGNGVHVTLEWGINGSYRNEIDIWGSKGSVSSERFFSKPTDYSPRFRFLDLYGNESYKPGRPENHFLTMFTAFRKLMVDLVDAENERMIITRRAQLTDKIKQVQV
jgi:predicted dehydrogenase